MLKTITSVFVQQKSCNFMFIHALRSVFGRVLLGTVLILLCSPEARAQFIVQPMEISLQGRAGSTIRTSFKLENRAKFENEYVTIRVVDLVQSRDGSWEVFDANTLSEPSSGYDSLLHLSCKDWLSIGREAAEVPAFDSTVESLMVKIPPKARGFYCAGLQVSLQPRDGVGGVTIRYDFVVPVCVVIEGRALTTDVKLVSSGLRFIEAKDDQQESASVVITVKNNGTSRSKLVPFASIWEVLPSRRRVVKRDLAFSPIAVIPGAEVDLAVDLQSKLPSGKYRIQTRLSVDGRRVKGLTQEIDFTNPGFAGETHEDAAMGLTPNQVDIELLPGRRGTHKMTIRNNSDEAIVVKAIPVLPSVMAGKVVHVRGEDLSCADWIEIIPNEVPIRAGGERNVTVVVRMPREDEMPVLAIDPSNHYATLKFYGFYRDRSSAGMASTMVNVMKKGAEANPEILGRNMSIQSLPGKPSQCQVVGVFANRGVIHVVPTCTGRIQSDGAPNSRTEHGILKMVNVDADRVLMPYETRQFSGEFDFSGIPAGKYIVTVRLDYGFGLNKQMQKLYEVYDDPSSGEKLIFSATANSESMASSGG